MTADTLPVAPRPAGFRPTVLVRAARRVWLTAGALLLCSLPLSAAALPAPAADPEASFATVLEERLADTGTAVDPVVMLLYQRRSFRAAWDDPARVSELLSLLENSADHGLDARDFAPAMLRTVAAADADSLAAQVERELLFSASLARFVQQVRHGKLDPRQLYADWNYSLPPGGYERAQTLESVLAAPTLQQAVDAHLPAPQQYRALQQALRVQRALTAAPPARLAGGAALRPGDRGARVAALRARLQAEHAAGGALPDLSGGDASRFDETLAEAVRRFQRRHGLKPDAVVGQQTVDALNVAPQVRVDQLRANLERLRWTAADLQGDRLEVDLTGYHAHLWIGGEAVWSARVIVGRPARATPALLDSLQHVVLNPKWVVPPTILREDVLPRLSSDPDYLARQRMRVVDRSGQTVDPQAIDWSDARRARAAYQLVQESGADGSLGVVKFALANDYAIFLHDTNARRQFGRAQRALSSGCVRVEHPLELARLLLAADAQDQWTDAALRSALASGRTRTIPVLHGLPVLLNYFTVVADDDGEVQFRADIYDRDRALVGALGRPAEAVYATFAPAH